MQNLKYKNKYLQISCDGGAATGKSTGARMISKKYKNCCIEGRDISTKILPNSDVKFFFKCNLNIAAKRRYIELKKLNSNIKYKDVKKALRIRNFSDINRKNSPLLKHRDSIEIDTGKLNKQTMMAKMSKYIDKIKRL